MLWALTSPVPDERTDLGAMSPVIVVRSRRRVRSERVPESVAVRLGAGLGVGEALGTRLAVGVGAGLALPVGAAVGLGLALGEAGTGVDSVAAAGVCPCETPKDQPRTASPPRTTGIAAPARSRAITLTSGR